MQHGGGGLHNHLSLTHKLPSTLTRSFLQLSPPQPFSSLDIDIDQRENAESEWLTATTRPTTTHHPPPLLEEGTGERGGSRMLACQVNVAAGCCFRAMYESLRQKSFLELIFSFFLLFSFCGRAVLPWCLRVVGICASSNLDFSCVA